MDLGWKIPFELESIEEVSLGLMPARVAARHRDRWELVFARPPEPAAGFMPWDGEQERSVGEPRFGAASGIIPKRYFDELVASEGETGLPACGDWVLAEPPEGGGPAVIRKRLSRSSVFVRKAAGPEIRGQTLSANADTALLAMGLDENYNPRRMERYLALSWDAGADPLVVLTKLDAAGSGEEAADKLRGVEAIAAGAPVMAVCALDGRGMEELSSALMPGTTSVLLGSSGAGKSTLLNALAGESLMSTGETRAIDGKGRHTTSTRELFLIRSGALLIDTPGMREIGLWEAEGGVETGFADVEELAQSCRFADCAHGDEPGCAVRAALEDGRLEEGRMRNYRALMREIAYQRRLSDAGAARAERQKWKAISKFQKDLKSAR
jgi:ribosome biogenesis GTPase